jgi:hypothetical protein
MDKALQELVWKRAKGVCEYCQRPQSLSIVPFEIDHIISLKHRGMTVAANLALSCVYCNSHKGPCVAGVDTESNQIVRLFHPRNDEWHDHFYWEGAMLCGRTPIGRATIATLEINHPDCVLVRQLLLDAGAFPEDQPGEGLSLGLPES